ncbi:PAQR family membrane homeostasis protein TrhA [Mammaliicoccus sp. Dog046]|uniref:PAQR family membrane homeostasis protein TrhA n=1 Tax=Mammaliicoccus sp. Dog046 TaxID=3034233 RepID=UPI002B2603C8|nr:hemolysin III family protein [Mammaliicoccus sp. Dog046]WQK85845.1 hemolysin III family protein [Mammaliicoccus sp. Dog046]
MNQINDTQAHQSKEGKVKETFKDIMPLSFGEEVGNAISHGVPAFLLLFFLPYASVVSYIHDGTLKSTSVSIYIISIMLMFLSSAVYHSMSSSSPQKYIMRIIDHSMIYIAICGTTTPIALVLVGGWYGWLIMAVQWGITIWGIIYKSTAKNVNHKLSLAMYLIMGWMGVLILPAIIHKTSLIFMLFILFGGLSYTIGAWFYAQKNRKYFHMIWHFFIVIASVFHFIAIMYFM